jgi:hypothetical protein
MRRALRRGILAALVVTVLPCGARADDAATQREAQARFEEGIARVKAGNFESARISFTQAYALLERPTILWNLALTDEKTGHVLEALDHFKRFVHGPMSDDDRVNAEKHIAGLMAQTAHLDVAAPAGAQVIVDGNPVGIAPLADAVDVLPGPHHVEVASARGGTKEADVEAGPGQRVHVSLMSVAETARPIALAPAGDEGTTAAVIDATGQTDTGGTSTARIAVVVLIGTTAAVSVGLGAYFAVQSRNNEHTAEAFLTDHSSSYCFQPTSENAATCSEWNDAVNAQRRDATLSDAMYVAGGVFAVGALVTWFLWPKDSKAVAVVPMPVGGGAGAGLGAVGRF